MRMIYNPGQSRVSAPDQERTSKKGGSGMALAAKMMCRIPDGK